MTRGVSFGPYELLGEVARGGMAEVHFAVRSDGRPPFPGAVRDFVALKRILPAQAEDENFRRFFEAEIELTVALRHPRVVRVVDWGHVGEEPYLAMEFIHGRALSKVLSVLASKGRRLPLPHVVFLVVQVLDALDCVHRAVDASGKSLDVVLCDISPSNIMLGYDGCATLIDFGIATSRLRFSEQIGLLKGKKTYMGPEQLRGMPLDRRADIFAMGVCLCEAVTCRSLFEGLTEFEIEEQIRRDQLPVLVSRALGESHALTGVITKAIAFDPAARFESAAAFADELRPLARLGRGSPVTSSDVAKILSLHLPEVIKLDEERLAVLERFTRRRSLPLATSLDPGEKTEPATLPGMKGAPRPGEN